MHLHFFRLSILSLVLTLGSLTLGSLTLGSLMHAPSATAQASSPAPQRSASSATVTKLLAPLLALPYRADGAMTATGEYTTFANPTRRFTQPGLNCSGFVLEACRKLIQTPLTVEKAGFDRWNDSGPHSPYGHDWDYGWDLLCNISDGHKALYLAPDGSTADPLRLDAFAAKGYDLHAPGQLEALLQRMRPDHIYLLSFNRSTARKPDVPQHYHVGLLVLNANHEPLLYQTTTQRKRSYVRNLASPKERAAFRKAFANTGSSRKYMAVIEIPMR